MLAHYHLSGDHRQPGKITGHNLLISLYLFMICDVMALPCSAYTVVPVPYGTVIDNPEAGLFHTHPDVTV